MVILRLCGVLFWIVGILLAASLVAMLCEWVRA